jgi:hypothetical protein
MVLYLPLAPLELAADVTKQPLLDPHATTHTAANGGGRATRLTSLQRFWAMAASVNSSCAPRGPRSLSRLSLKIRFKCANNISTRLRSRRDCSKASVLESARAVSRASSLTSRGIMSAGVFGQHLGLRGHALQCDGGFWRWQRRRSPSVRIFHNSRC